MPNVAEHWPACQGVDMTPPDVVLESMARNIANQPDQAGARRSANRIQRLYPQSAERVLRRARELWREKRR